MRGHANLKQRAGCHIITRAWHETAKLHRVIMVD